MGTASAATATAAKLNAALIMVTWLGVSPSRYAPAARYRPAGRFTNREYSDTPFALFCADFSRISADAVLLIDPPGPHDLTGRSPDPHHHR